MSLSRKRIIDGIAAPSSPFWGAGCALERFKLPNQGVESCAANSGIMAGPPSKLRTRPRRSGSCEVRPAGANPPGSQSSQPQPRTKSACPGAHRPASSAALCRRCRQDRHRRLEPAQQVLSQRLPGARRGAGEGRGGQQRAAQLLGQVLHPDHLVDRDADDRELQDASEYSDNAVNNNGEPHWKTPPGINAWTGAISTGRQHPHQ